MICLLLEWLPLQRGSLSPSGVTPLVKGGKSKNDRAASPESALIHLKTLLTSVYWTSCIPESSLIPDSSLSILWEIDLNAEQPWGNDPEIQKTAVGVHQSDTPSIHAPSHSHLNLKIKITSWLVGCFGFNGPLRQYFSLYRAVSQKEGERKRKNRWEQKSPNNPHPHLLQPQ